MHRLAQLTRYRPGPIAIVLADVPDDNHREYEYTNEYAHAHQGGTELLNSTYDVESNFRQFASA